MISPDLGSRFLAPSGWMDAEFVNNETRHKIRYGYVMPQGAPPKAIVVTLPGLSEFCEKYFETAHDMLDRGYGFFCIDWHYQGRSGRMPAFPQRRHSDGFDTDLKDLDLWIKQHVIPMVKNGEKSSPLPIVMLAHSMGGKIGLRYLSEHPGIFNAAAFSAPYLGIFGLSKLQWLAAQILPHIPHLHDSYIPAGSDWYQNKPRINLTGDKLRDTIHGAWSAANEALQLGDPTIRWIGESFASFNRIRSPGYLEKIDIPVLLALSQFETVVDNGEIRRAAARLPNVMLLEIPGGRHEILMETDERRGRFLSGFDKMLKDNKIIP